MPAGQSAHHSQEFAAGHVRGALNLEVTKFQDKALLDGLIKEVSAARCAPAGRECCLPLPAAAVVAESLTAPDDPPPPLPPPPLSKVVVHCQLSKVRGPLAASLLVERLKELAAAGAAGPQPEVVVLRGGFQQYGEQFQDDPQLVEGSGPSPGNAGHH
jgi:hypothetical protein